MNTPSANALSIISLNYSDQPVRIAVRDDAPWFVAADVCGVLSISDVRQAVRRLDDDERGVCEIPTPGGRQQATTISESGMYALVLRSNKPQARAFRKWVTAEVLPALRRHGRYEIGTRPAVARIERADLMALRNIANWFHYNFHYGETAAHYYWERLRSVAAVPRISEAAAVDTPLVLQEARRLQEVAETFIDAQREAQLVFVRTRLRQAELTLVK